MVGEEKKGPRKRGQEAFTFTIYIGKGNTFTIYIGKGKLVHPFSTRPRSGVVHSRRMKKFVS